MLNYKVLIAFIITHSFFTFILFNSIYLDADQLLIADQAKFMSQGFFFEPYFYGQNYLLPLEAYASAILIYAGLNPIFSIKVIATIFFYFPFIYSIMNLRSGLISLLIICFIVLLPVKFFIIGSMPRGFILDSVLAWFAINRLINENVDDFFSLFFLGGLFGFCLIAFSGVVFLLCLLLLIITRVRKLILFTCGLVAGICLGKLIGFFYLIHPDYAIHHQWNMDFSIKVLMKNIQNLYSIKVLVRLLAPGAFLATLCLLAFPIKLSQKEKILYLLVILAVILSCFGAFGFEKTGDYYRETPFFSMERMFLVLPYIFCSLFIYISKTNLAELLTVPFGFRKIMCLGILGYLVFFTFEIYAKRESWVKEIAPVQITSLKNLVSLCLQFPDYSSASYLIIPQRNDLLAYGCNALYDIPIVQPEYERRTWIKNFYERSGRIPKIISSNSMPQQ